MSVPTTILTGFLGSGKTTLLNRLLKEPQMAGSLVIVNEFGEVGLDHQILAELAEDTVLLASGCVCCQLRDDLVTTLQAVQAGQFASGGRVIERVFLETTGLADPRPLLSIFGPHSPVAQDFHLEAVVSTLDACFGQGAIDSSAEARSQLLVADAVVVTKLDLCEAPESRFFALRESAEQLGSRAQLFRGDHPELVEQLLNLGLQDSRDGSLDPERWLAFSRTSRLQASSQGFPRGAGVRLPSGQAAGSRHGTGSLALSFNAAMDWRLFSAWLALFTQMNAERLPRFKAIIFRADLPEVPVVVDAIRNFVHPPTLLPQCPGIAPVSRVVVLHEGLAPQELEMVEQGLRACLQPA